MAVKLPPVPRFRPVDKRQVELNFYGTVAAAGQATALSGLITYKYRILQAKMIFTDDANNNIVISWFISPNSSTSATGAPSGQNIFGRENPNTAFIGDNLVRVVNCNVKVEEEGTYIKLYVVNNGTAVFTFNCALVIQEL